MKLSHDDLIALLAESLQVKTPDAEEILDSWVKKIHAAVAEKGSYRAAGFGTFRRQDGALVFEPETELAIEINYKYAGMEPIEILSAPARKSSGIKSPDTEEQPVAPEAADADKDLEPVDDHAADEPAKEDKLLSGDTEAEATSKQEEKAEEPETTDPPESVEEEPSAGLKDDVSKTDDAAKQEQKESDPPPAHKKEAAAGTGRMKKKHAPKRRKRRESESKLWLIPIAAAVIVAILFVLHFDGLRLDRQHHAEQPPAEDPSATVTEREATAPPEHVIEPSPEPSPYGLMGSGTEIQTGSYTIVLHSLSSETRANYEKERFAEQGYLAVLYRAGTTDGRTTWRVGVGQFATVSDAEDAISELPRPYRDNNFIARIR
ncbi:SPOR domain-containing protein [Balneolales bacterium ANBcel1]|nr:SPOR domain-containing protein [Balneolales bacterium ANBcel1]